MRRGRLRFGRGRTGRGGREEAVDGLLALVAHAVSFGDLLTRLFDELWRPRTRSAWPLFRPGASAHGGPVGDFAAELLQLIRVRVHAHFEVGVRRGRRWDLGAQVLDFAELLHFVVEEPGDKVVLRRQQPGREDECVSELYNSPGARICAAPLPLRVCASEAKLVGSAQVGKRRSGTGAPR